MPMQLIVSLRIWLAGEHFWLKLLKASFGDLASEAAILMLMELLVSLRILLNGALRHVFGTDLEQPQPQLLPAEQDSQRNYLIHYHGDGTFQRYVAEAGLEHL